LSFRIRKYRIHRLNFRNAEAQLYASYSFTSNISINVEHSRILHVNDPSILTLGRREFFVTLDTARVENDPQRENQLCQLPDNIYQQTFSTCFSSSVAIQWD